MVRWNNTKAVGDECLVAKATPVYISLKLKGMKESSTIYFDGGDIR